MICYTEASGDAEPAEGGSATTRGPISAGVVGGPPRAVAVGYFDGLHAGHRRLLVELRGWAAERGAEPAVVTFDRHPREVLQGRGPQRILSLRHRLVLLAREGVAATLCLRFTREMARWSPEEFLDRICRRALGGRYLLFGFDSAFGRGRSGTFEHVSSLAPSLGLEVRQASVERLDGERVSSTLVREAIVSGDLERLARLLGREYSVVGRVVHGDRRGRTLGFPTANLDVEGAFFPPGGVYFAEARALDGIPGDSDPSTWNGREIPGPEPSGPWIGALANIGVRPTFVDGQPRDAQGSLEVHLPDFRGDLYGSLLEVRFLHRHRPERKFPDAAQLAMQIREDLEAFRAHAGTRSAGRTREGVPE